MSDPLGLSVDTPAPVLELRDQLGAEWPWILASREKSAAMMERLRRELDTPHLTPADTTLVVFGSLARGEFTDGSDIDWTLLVDGMAASYHQDAARRISGRLEEMKLAAPSSRGPFGSMTFSHDLLHNIGGDDDTNRNTTQRLLLLLESAPVGREHAAYDRVVSSVLARYVEEDIVGPGDSAYRVPRFLQNDVARYWRTMAVDFAHKRRVRGQGWALRNAKLRLSRKLMYTAGLVTCFSCDSAFRARTRSQPWHEAQQVEDYLAGLVRTTPLDIMAGVVLSYFGELSGAARVLFGAYDEFLGMLHDERIRKHLKALSDTAADGDVVYKRVRKVGNEFQDALTDIFFVCDTPLRELTIRYGVF